MDFDTWKSRVDEIIALKTGFTTDDLPDEDYWSNWDDGLTPDDMAGIVMDNNDWINC